MIALFIWTIGDVVDVFLWLFIIVVSMLVVRRERK
jgi:hypothetical protein